MDTVAKTAIIASRSILVTTTKNNIAKDNVPLIDFFCVVLEGYYRFPHVMAHAAQQTLLALRTYYSVELHRKNNPPKN